ncbi:hypothetical protein DFH09DRAFT_1095992 [Mycena vulgaris]|nr:hypothetical protein DFH09DRAFT_1095992 [Mycena vulgaris]
MSHIGEDSQLSFSQHQDACVGSVGGIKAVEFNQVHPITVRVQHCNRAAVPLEGHVPTAGGRPSTQAVHGSTIALNCDTDTESSNKCATSLLPSLDPSRASISASDHCCSSTRRTTARFSNIPSCDSTSLGATGRSNASALCPWFCNSVAAAGLAFTVNGEISTGAVALRVRVRGWPWGWNWDYEAPEGLLADNDAVWLAELASDADTGADIERHEVTSPLTTLNELDRTINCVMSEMAAIWYPPGIVFTEDHVKLQATSVPRDLQISEKAWDSLKQLETHVKSLNSLELVRSSFRYTFEALRSRPKVTCWTMPLQAHWSMSRSSCLHPSPLEVHDIVNPSPPPLLCRTLECYTAWSAEHRAEPNEHPFSTLISSVVRCIVYSNTIPPNSLIVPDSGLKMLPIDTNFNGKLGGKHRQTVSG